MTKRVEKSIAKFSLALLLSTVLFAACGGDDDVLEGQYVGYWFKLSSTDGRLISDTSGYIWGLQIKGNGQVTIARWDNSSGAIVIDENGPAFTLTNMSLGAFTGTDGANTISGTYAMDTTVLTDSTGDFLYNRLYLDSEMLSVSFLPGGTAGDWMVAGHYAKVFTLGGDWADLGPAPQ